MTNIPTLALVVGLFLTLQELIDTRHATNRSLELTESGQRNDRFTNATEQLANGALTERLAGILTLDQVAKDDPMTYHQAVFEVLSAFVRIRVNPVSAFDQGSQATPFLTDHQGVAGNGAYDDSESLADVQAAFRVILDRDPNYDLACVDLTDVDFRHVDTAGLFTGRSPSESEGKMPIANICFDGSNLEGVAFSGSDLIGVSFANASVNRVDFVDADLTCVSFSGAFADQSNDFRGATFWAVDGHSQSGVLDDLSSNQLDHMTSG